MSWIYLRAGRRAEAERIVAELLAAQTDRYLAATTVALNALALGDLETAFREFDRALHDADPNLQYISESTYVAGVRNDPRFTAVLRRMNVAS